MYVSDTSKEILNEILMCNAAFIHQHCFVTVIPTLFTGTINKVVYPVMALVKSQVSGKNFLTLCTTCNCPPPELGTDSLSAPACPGTASGLINITSSSSNR